MKIWLSSFVGGVLLLSVPAYAASDRPYDPYFDFDNMPQQQSTPSKLQPATNSGSSFSVGYPSGNNRGSIKNTTPSQAQTIRSGNGPSSSSPAYTPSGRPASSATSATYGTETSEIFGIPKQRTTPSGMQGQIQQTQQAQQPQQSQASQPVQASLTADSYVQVSQVPIPVEGRLKKKFQGLKITLKNRQGNYIEVIRGDIVNGVDGQTAYQQTDNSQARGFWSSLATAPLNYVPYGGYGSSAVSTAANYGGSVSDQNTSNSAYNKVKSFPNGVLSPNDEISIYTLVPVNERPQVKIIFRDLKSNEMFTFTQ